MAAEYLEHVHRACYVDSCRALNRTALGLPLDRPSTDAEVAEMAARDRETARMLDGRALRILEGALAP